MLFNSIDFAVFLPIFFILYWFIFNKKLKSQNLLIVISSYFFYGWWDYKSLLDSLWQKSISSNVHFLDYSKDNRFLLDSYTDYVHLNSKGAELFSKILDNDIKKIFYEK